MKKFLAIAIPSILLFGCKPEPNNSFDADDMLVEIHDAQLTKDTTALLTFLDSEDATYRAQAAMLFGSIPSSSARAKLETLLSDPSWEVRQGAAYALGQYGEKASLEPLESALENESHPQAKATMLEAFGKCGDVRHLAYLTNFQAENDTVITGWAYGMYRLGVFSVNSVEKAIAYFGRARSLAARKALAFYLGDTRTGDYRTMQSFGKSLQALCNETSDPIIKSYLITAQQSIGLDKKLEFLQRTYESSSHPVVHYRCIQQLCFTPDGSFMKGIARQYLRDSSLHIRLNVMDWLASTADSNDATYFRKGLEVEGNELLLVKLFKGWLRATGGSREAVEALLANADKFENLQARADLYALLTQYANRYAEPLLQAAYHTEFPVVSYRIVEGIRSYYKRNPVPDSVRQTIGAHSIFLIKSGKDPLNTFGAGLLADTNIQAFSIMERTVWLEDLIKEETNPRVEYALMRALRSMKGAPLQGRGYFLADHAKPAWDAITQIPGAVKVQMHTSKGTFTIDLFLENAPMSVGRFYELCQSGYYDSTVVHRVVFPHVVQGGSQFGDGHNDDLQPIKTETTLRHFDEPGLVGFASDGRDTETGQFFITHVPRPHLDENFTILGKVIAGMDVVNSIHKGDMVLKTEIADE